MKAIHLLVPLGLLGASAGTALAQPSLPPADDPPMLPGDPEEPPPVVTPMPPDGAPRPPPPQPPPPMAAEPAPQRPTAFAIGLGLGYVIPSDLSTPSVTSARVRLPSGLTFEPRVTLGHETQTQDDGIDKTETGINSVELALAVRYPLRSHGKVDLSLIGAAGVSLTTVDPEGDDNNRSINGFTVGWGVALDYWVTQHWNVSFTATNPILVTNTLNQEQGPGVESSDGRTTIGAIFDPTLAVMLHLYL